jgi:predicted ester cyclase
MSIEENKKIIHRIYDNEAVHRGLDYLDDLVSANVVNHNPFPGTGPGIEGVKQAITAMLGLFPDARFTVDEMIGEGDKVAVRVTLRGTHQGSFMGRPPTGATVTSTELIVFRIAAGKVVETWASRDDLGMMRQLGGTPNDGVLGRSR